MPPPDGTDCPALPRLRVCLVIGTRPEAIKLAPLAIALHAQPAVEPIITCSGQHAELAPGMLAHFGLRPDRMLPPVPAGQHLSKSAPMLHASLAASFAEDRPHVIVVQGDTLSAFAGALAASYARIPLVHVEAGLRSGKRSEPYPEEAHRRAIAAFADLHCAPTASARQALLDEGCPAADVLLSGNTVIDALRLMRDRVPANDLVDTELPIIVVTCHRRENWGARYEAVCRALRRLAQRGDCGILFVTHPNPNLSRVAQSLLGGRHGLRLSPPLPYPAFMNLLERAALVLTDSGGIQEEAAALGVPTLVLRNTTERPEGVDAGIARLVGTAEDDIVATVGALLDDVPALKASRVPCDAYGDGRAALRIVTAIMQRWGGGALPQISDAAAAFGSKQLA